MMHYDDNQKWIYKHKEPFFPQDPAFHYVPYMGRPLGDESYRRTTVISTLGRGPKGPKGDTMVYSDLSDSEKNDLAKRIGYMEVSVEYKIFKKVLDPNEVVVAVDPGFGKMEQGDFYSVKINGLDMPDQEFSIDEQTGVISFNAITGGPLNDVIVVRRLRFGVYQDQDVGSLTDADIDEACQ